MARHTSWRTGGSARRYYRPVDIDDLALFLSTLPENELVMWLGLGSNLLIRDGGIPGTVIATSGVLDGIERLDENTVRVEAGVACAKVARYCSRENLLGADFLVGIPGTMGGALAMNAGAFGGETWSLIKAVETIDRHGQRHTRQPHDFQVSYRHVQGPVGEWFVAAYLQLQKGEGQQQSLQMKALLKKRSDSQPTGEPSCGSVFRNPEGDYAGRLIEAAGLKGFCIGGACVSDKHANFIINNGAATATDIEMLIIRIAEVVEDQYGVRLIPEVHIVGELPEGVSLDGLSGRGKV